jgi:hypothetical protein
MKKSVLFIAFMAIFFSCKKQDEMAGLQNEIIGTWELEKIFCGLCTTPVVDFPFGNNNIIILSSNGMYERKKNDTLLFKGTYSVLKSKDCNTTTGDMALLINEGVNPTPMFINIIGDKLELSTPYCYSDYNAVSYHRIK